MEVDNAEEDIDGSIHSIHVKNFFCHDNLEITFNRNVNFVVGRNGSGKSAILTALVVGLGGRAAATNRGNNLHSFIRKGANSATVEIKIKNSTDNAYKYDLYGNYITIVRTITTSGNSSYKIKSASGEIISTKFEEVNAIILAHDIQVDNPISVLNQDDARSFHASDAKKKYALFRKATNLDQTETNYIRALENCEKATTVWKKKSEACLELEKEYKKWETKYEQLQSRVKTEQRKRKLQDEYYWSEIAEYEKDGANLQKQYDEQKTQIDKLVEKLSSIEQNYGNDNETINALKNSLREKNREKSSLQNELLRLEAEVREIQSSWRNSQKTVNKQQDLYNREKRKIADLEREIHNLRSGEAEAQHEAQEERAKDAERAAEETRARYNTAQNDVKQACINKQHAAQAAEDSASRVQRQKDLIKQLKMQLHELESRGTDSLAVYGRNMVELCQRVKEQAKKGGFSAMPRGPVGAYLKVKDKKWASALEHIIGGSIQSFCVNTAEDSRRLFELMAAVYGDGAKPSVTCSKFLNTKHDVRRNQVQSPGFMSALESLDISDPVIANFLIDNIGLEGILLVPEHEDAMRLSDNVENVPHNCSKVVTLDSTEFHPAPNYRSYGGARRASRYLQVSTADRKRQVQSETAEAEASLARLENARAAAAAEAEAAAAAEAAGSCAAAALLQALHERAAAARAARDAAQRHRAFSHHAVLVEEMEVSKQRLNTLNSELEGFSEQEQTYKDKQDACNNRIDSIKSNLMQVSSACRDLNEELGEIEMRIGNSATERSSCEKKLAEDRERLAAAQRQLQQKLDLIQQKTSLALQLCPRVQSPREKQSLVAELRQLELKLRSLRADGLSREEVGARLLALQKRYSHSRKVLDKLLSLINEVKKTSEQHLNFCHKVQSYVAKRVQYSFQAMLTLRGFAGRMELDAATGRLALACFGRGRERASSAASAASASSAASLSGGERSYATVAFVMALWDCVELPFYFLDEFDVFMDNVNRKIVMELLVDYALKNRSRQFVFLTPQDASSVNAGPNVKIHRMADPRR